MEKDWNTILDKIKHFKISNLPSRSDVINSVIRSAGKIPFADDVLAMWFCAVDDKTPSKIKAAIIGALAYFVLPLDLIPDMVLGLGFSDDIAVLTAVLALVTSHITPEHRERAKKALNGDDTGVPDESPITPLD